MTDARYHLSRGDVPTRIVEVSGADRGGEPGAAPGPRAVGSAPDHAVPGLDAEALGELAIPTRDPGPTGRGPMAGAAARTVVTFGTTEVAIEHHGDRVALVLPGMVRLVGTVAEAQALAALLTRTAP